MAGFAQDGRVGRNHSASAPTPAPTPTASPAATPLPSTNIIDTLNAKLNASKVPMATSKSVPGSLNTESFSTDQLSSIGSILKKLGYSVKATGSSIKTTILQNSELNTMLSNSNSYADFVNKLASDYLPGLSTQKAVAENLPSRSVYKYQPQDIYDIVNNVYQSTLGRDATDQEKQQQYSLLKPMIDAGTVSTSAKVKNPKTGKMEVVTTQTPEFSKTAAEANLTASLQKTNKVEVDRKKALDFSSALNSLLSGGM